MNITYTYFQTPDTVNPNICSLIQVSTRFIFCFGRPDKQRNRKQFSPTPSHAITAHVRDIYRKRVSAPLRRGGVPFVGLSMLFEYTVVERGWSRIASDVFRSVSRTQLDAAVVSVGNDHHPGLDCNV